MKPKNKIWIYVLIIMGLLIKVIIAGFFVLKTIH